MGVFEQSIRSFLSPIRDLLDDPTVSEIMINGPKDIWIEQKGKVYKTEKVFADETSLQAAIRNIAQFVGRKIDEENPSLDARLPDGSRIHAVIPPAARNGTTIAIRKFSKAADLNMQKLVEFGAISADAARFLAICVHMGKNIIVSGGTGSGKTTILNMMGSVVPPTQRIIIIEDATELKVPTPHVVYFETKAPNESGVGGLTIRDLIKSSMRLRPDRIIVGEVRGPEALDLITVMNTGHGGTMGTVHSNSPADALIRLETLAMMSDTPVPVSALRQQIASAIHLVLQAKRFHDGSRKISHISEVVGVDENGRYSVRDLFRFVQKGKKQDGTIVGAMEACGNLPTFMGEVEVNGYPFTRQKFAKPGMPTEAAKPGQGKPGAPPATKPPSGDGGGEQSAA